MTLHAHGSLLRRVYIVHDAVPAERLAVLSRTELVCIFYCTNSPNQQRRSTNNFQRSARYHDGIRLLWRDTMMVSALSGSPGVGIAVGRGRKLVCGWIWDTIWETPAITR